MPVVEEVCTITAKGQTTLPKEIRKALGVRIRNQARIVPQLVFFIDEVEENAERIESLIKNLTIPKEDKE